MVNRRVHTSTAAEATAFMKKGEPTGKRENSTKHMKQTAVVRYNITTIIII